MTISDRDLGMGRPIQRRDFLNGVLVSGAAMLGPRDRARAAEPVAYPPALTGMRGSGYPTAYSTGHALRDHVFAPSAGWRRRGSISSATAAARACW